jgi:hypothetical protein
MRQREPQPAVPTPGMPDDECTLPFERIEHRHRVCNLLRGGERPIQCQELQPTLLIGRDADSPAARRA